MNTLLQEIPRPTVVRFPRPTPSVDFLEVECGYRPGGSLGLSFVTHLLVVFFVAFLGRHAFLRPRIVLEHPPIASADHIVYLPSLGGGKEGGGDAGGGKGSEGSVSSGLRARSRQGFAYPGSQPMLSSPEQARLGIQTLLQPSLKNLRPLQHLVELPNIVQPPAASEATPKQPALVVKSEQLALKEPTETPVAAPKMVVPVAPDGGLAALVESKRPLPQKRVPGPVKASELAADSRTPNGLLVLNAIPPPPDVRGVIPRAEVRAMFAVSPAEATVIAEPAAGSEAGGQSAAAAGNGNQTGIRSGDALAEVASGGATAEHRADGSGKGSGGRYGNGQGSGLNTERGGGIAGRGDLSGSATGAGSARGTGSGSGGGSAPGSGSFTGISIQGGRYGNGGSASMLAKSSPSPQTSYNMTVVSTGSSGGGLPDIGFFRNEKVYTVYLDMRSTSDDPAPSWTLQYSVAQPAGTAQDFTVRDPGTPSPPYAMLKEIPEFSPELLHNSRRSLILVSAILDASGRLYDLAVRQSPEGRLDAPLVEALRQWQFQPAVIAGRPVSLKVLIGIRLAAPHNQS